MKNFYNKNNLTPVINVSGFMTKIGASITNKKSIKAANDIFEYFVNIDELQALASKRISKLLKTEAAVITASAAAGLTESVASMMTGKDLKKVFKLPDSKNMVNKVVNGKIYLKTENSTDFEVLDQIEDGFFYDDQYGKEIQQLIENEYRILNITNDGPLDYTPEYEIPKDKFFFMGDNRDNSSDSRILSGVGFVPKVNIVGKVWFIWFSVDTNFSLSKFWNLPFHIRYDRLFSIIK